MAVEFGNGSGLAEVFHTKSDCPVAGNATEPGEGCRMAVDHGDQQAMAGHITQ